LARPVDPSFFWVALEGDSVWVWVVMDVSRFDWCPADAAWFMGGYELSELFTCIWHMLFSGVSVEPPPCCLACVGDVGLVFSRSEHGIY